MWDLAVKYTLLNIMDTIFADLYQNWEKDKTFCQKTREVTKQDPLSPHLSQFCPHTSPNSAPTPLPILLPHLSQFCPHSTL